jgi:hypothetical protein
VPAPVLARLIAHELGHLSLVHRHGFTVTRSERPPLPARPAGRWDVPCGGRALHAARRRGAALVGDWVGSGRPYLGLCFGAQVLAAAR